jgi:hypothetical protein
MADQRDGTATDGEPGEQPATAIRRPWRTPRVIVSDAGDTQNASNILDDGAQSIS